MNYRPNGRDSNDFEPTCVENPGPRRSYPCCSKGAVDRVGAEQGKESGWGKKQLGLHGEKLKYHMMICLHIKNGRCKTNALIGSPPPAMVKQYFLIL